MVNDKNDEPAAEAELLATGNEEYDFADYFPNAAFIESVDHIFKWPTSGDAGLDRLGNVFSTNLVAAVLTASTLRVFARRSAYETGYLTMLGISMGATGGADNCVEKAKESLEKDLKEIRWETSLREMADSVSQNNLKKFIGDVHGRNAVGQIMNQCAVLTWSSLEVLASDTFVYLLNSKPAFAGLLLRDDVLKKYYRDKDIAAALEEYNYNLSCHMGDALIRARRLDDLAAIKSVYGVLLPLGVGLRETLSEAQLWKLYKMRNLIVHRAGVVDAFFQKETGDARPVGTKLTVTAGDLKNFVILVAKAGAQLLEAAAVALKEPPNANAAQMDLPTYEKPQD